MPVLHQNSLGRISLTTDLWSDPNLDSYMAVTAHFMMRDETSGCIVFRTHLIAFRFIDGPHSGAHLGQEFLKITDDLEISNKVCHIPPSLVMIRTQRIQFGQITMDNASNNNTLMAEIESELRRRGIPFDRNGNRLR